MTCPDCGKEMEPGDGVPDANGTWLVAGCWHHDESGYHSFRAIYQTSGEIKKITSTVGWSYA